MSDGRGVIVADSPDCAGVALRDSVVCAEGAEPGPGVVPGAGLSRLQFANSSMITENDKRPTFFFILRPPEVQIEFLSRLGCQEGKRMDM